MKKLFLSLLIIIGVSQFAKAQVDLGAGFFVSDAAYGSIAIEAKADFPMGDMFSLSPSFDFFIPNPDYYWYDGRNVLLLAGNLDVHYHLTFIDVDGLDPYGLAGASVSNRNYVWNGPNAPIWVNIGAGSTYEFTDTMKAFAELKYTRFGPSLSAGVYFSL